MPISMWPPGLLQELMSVFSLGVLSSKHKNGYVSSFRSKNIINRNRNCWGNVPCQHILRTYCEKFSLIWFFDQETDIILFSSEMWDNPPPPSKKIILYFKVPPPPPYHLHDFSCISALFVLWFWFWDWFSVVILFSRWLLWELLYFVDVCWELLGDGLGPILQPLWLLCCSPPPGLVL